MFTFLCDGKCALVGTDYYGADVGVRVLKIGDLLVYQRTVEDKIGSSYVDETVLSMSHLGWLLSRGTKYAT